MIAESQHFLVKSAYRFSATMCKCSKNCCKQFFKIPLMLIKTDKYYLKKMAKKFPHLWSTQDLIGDGLTDSTHENQHSS